ncbi:MAG: hypothetical protein R2828_18855 [Saprospiraceae bacterium]
MKQRWFQVAIFNFLLAATMGALLRFAFVEEVSWLNFKNFLHAHSHIAMLGWVYLALYALLVDTFVSSEQQQSKDYNRLFWVTQFSVIGMALSFPVQGYGVVAITFSTLHILCSYLFVRWIWQAMRGQNTFSVRMLKTALFCLVFSTLGVWAMGPIMASGLRHSEWYYMSVQFYLHFQFNGWFLFAILALLFKVLETKEMVFVPSNLRLFYRFLLVSCVLTYALAVAWSQPVFAIFMANGVGVIFQLLALLLFLRLIWAKRVFIMASFSRLERRLLRLAFSAFVLKIMIQTLVLIPFFARAAYTIRNYVIGFIHLVLLGAVTCFLLAFALHAKQLSRQKKTTSLGIYLIVVGFILSELLLFLQGSMLWAAMGFLPYYYALLFGFSALLPLGVFFLWVGQWGTNKA